MAIAQRKALSTVITSMKNGEVEVFKSLKALCRAMDWSYNTLSRYKLPHTYKGYFIEKKLIQL